MLVLSRQVGQRLYLNRGDEEIVITVVRISQATARFGIEADQSWKIVREELIGIEPSDKNETSHTPSHESGTAGQNSPAAINS